MNQLYRIRIKTERSEVEVESSEKSFVEEKFEELTKQYITMSKSTHAEVRVSSGKKESLNEFLGRVKLKSGTEHTVAIAYYLEKVEGVEEITVKDIREGFQRAKFPHSNPSQALVDGKTQGLLMDGSAPKHYVVTGTGEKWVENRMQNISEEISK